MKVTFTDGRVFNLAGTDTLLNTEAMAIERATGWEMADFLAKLGKQSVLAMTAFVWVMAKRMEPTLRFDDVEFSFDALEKTEDDDEQPDPKDPDGQE